MKKKGFTLVELLAVIIIISIIAMITTPIIWNYVNDAKKEAYEHQLLEIYKAAELYFTDNAITIENGQIMYVSINELVVNDYLDSVPNDNLHGGKMDGIIEATGTQTNYLYQYYDSEELKDKSSIIVVDKEKTMKSVVVNGKTIANEVSLLQSVAEEVVGTSTNSEMMTIEGYRALVTDSDDIASVKTEWFQDIFLPNTVYTFHIESRAIASSSINPIYHPKMRFVYVDGTTSVEYEIGNHADGKFTTYEWKSDAGKSVRAIEFTTDEESPYRFAFNLETFSLTPDTVASYSNQKVFTSLGDNGIVKLKVVNVDGTISEKRITLLDPLRSIENTDIKDEIILYANGSVEVKRRIGKITVNGLRLNTSNLLLYPNSESTNGYHCFYFPVFTNRISSTYDVMSNTFPYLQSVWSNTVNRIGISATPNTNSENYVYIKVPKSEFPTPQSFLDWIKENPIDIYYELKTPEVETLSSIELDTSKINYIYVDSDLSPDIIMNYN